MTKTYEIVGAGESDEMKIIQVSETKPTTTEKSVSVFNLKLDHTNILAEIERKKLEADLIVDELAGIDADEGIDITVDDIPTKFDVGTIEPK